MPRVSGSHRGEIRIVDEVTGARIRQQLIGEHAGQPEIRRQRERVIDEIPRVAAAQSDLPGPQLPLEQPVDQPAVACELAIAAAVFENGRTSLVMVVPPPINE